MFVVGLRRSYTGKRAYIAVLSKAIHRDTAFETPGFDDHAQEAGGVVAGLGLRLVVDVGHCLVELAFSVAPQGSWTVV